MNDQTLIESLLKQDEGPCLDFKSEPYRLNTNHSKAEFIKDIISMANTPRDGSAYIVIGVRIEGDRSKTVIGVTEHPDDADLQSLVKSKVNPVPQFHYRSVEYRNKRLGLIENYPKRVGPFLPTWKQEEVQGVLRYSVIYFRRGSENDEAQPDERNMIWEWMHPKMPTEDITPRVTTPTTLSFEEVPPKKIAVGIPLHEELADEFLKDPFQNAPLLSYYSQKIRGQPLAGKRILSLLHFLRDLIPFVEATNKLGLDPKTSYFYYKEYPYPQREAIAHWLREQGYNVNPVAELAVDLETLEHKDTTDIGEILIIEDGGHIYPRIMRNCPRILHQTLGCVEQTTRGIRNIESTLEELGITPDVPVLSVAGSRLKAEFEPPHIADAAVANIRSLLSDVDLRGKAVALLGYGTIGEQIAKRLRDEGMLLTVYDPDDGRRLKASQAGLDCVESSLQAVRDKFLVIGSSGECTVGRDEILTLRHRTHLASASSEQYEFDIHELHALSGGRTEPFTSEARLAGTVYKLRKDNIEVVLLANGYPVNFWGLNSMPDQASDLILSLLLLSLVDLADGKMARGGIGSKRVNELAENHKVAKLYLDHHEGYRALVPSKPFVPVESVPADHPEMLPSLEQMAETMRQYRRLIENDTQTHSFRPRREGYFIPLGFEQLGQEVDKLSTQSTGRINTLSEALRQRPRWVVLGESGSGKTALLEQYIIDWSNETWAVLITAKDLATNPIALIRQALAEYGLNAPEEAIQAGLAANRFCLLIDGFDEQGDARREQIRQLGINPDYIHVPIIVSAREIFYLDRPENECLPRHFGLLRVKPVSPTQIRDYLISRLGPEQGIDNWKVIRTRQLEAVFRTPLSLDKFAERQKRQPGQPVPRSKSELLKNYFNDFFSTWELHKGRRTPDIEIKREILKRLAAFLFERGSYTVPLPDFQSRLRTIWENLLKRPIMPSDPEPLEFLKEHGLIAQRDNEIGFALPVYRDFFLIEAGISTTRTWQERWRLAEICRELDFDVEAEELYRRAALDSQASGPCRIAAALYCKTRGAYATAAELLQLEQRLRSHNPVGYQAYAVMLKEQGRFDEAEAQFRKGLKADPTHAPTYQAYALMLHEQGQFEEAKPLLKEAIRLQPDEVRYRTLWANFLFYCLDAVEEADVVVKDLLNRDDIGRKNQKNLNRTSRLIAWRRAVLAGSAEAIRDVDRRSQYAVQLIYHDNHQRAIEELRVLIEQHPEYAPGLWHLGNTLDIHVQQGMGLEYLLKAVSLDSQNPRYRFALAHSAIRVGRFDLAHPQLDWLISQSPTNVEHSELGLVDYLCTRGFAFKEAKQWEEAEAACQIAINVATTSEKRARALKNLAQVIMEQDDPQRWEVAWKLLERAWALHPSDPTIYGTRRRLADKLGRSARIDNPYQLMRQRLEPGDPITVKVYQIDETNGIVRVYYYGVPGNLSWIEGSEKLQIGKQIGNVLVQSVDKEGNLRLIWPLLEKVRQMGLEPGQYIDAQVSGSQPFGVLVDYHGIPGLVHRSKLPDPEAFDPKTFLIRKGESIRCRVLRIQSDGKLELAWETQ